MRKIIIHSIAALAFLLPACTNAHPVTYKAISTEFDIRGASITFRTRVQHIFDYDAPTPEETKKVLTAYFGAKLAIATPQGSCVPAVTQYESDSLGAVSIFEGTYQCKNIIDPYKELVISSTLFEEFFEEFDHYIELRADNSQREIILNRGDPKFHGILFEQQPRSSTTTTADGDNQTKNTFFATSKRFALLGVEHIFLGFDHILFLVATVLIISSLGKIGVLVTSFTIAHSITLILAGLNWLTITPRIVEPAIALSIAYMAARNIWILHKRAPERIHERVAGTFGLGLIHGLGFAGALKEIEIPARYFLPALLTFNIGIEIGQIVLLAALLPVLKYIEIKKFPWRNIALISVSLLIIIAALLWFIERILYAV